MKRLISQEHKELTPFMNLSKSHYCMLLLIKAQDYIWLGFLINYSSSLLQAHATASNDFQAHELSVSTFLTKTLSIIQILCAKLLGKIYYKPQIYSKAKREG